jgi:uncharacterized protein (TIGR00288 family)
MNDRSKSPNMAVFCDFENIAIGVRESNYAAFDIRKVLEKLLLKGAIVVKKAYADWERYSDFKKPMHEAAFELIDIPHVRMTGKNSADIRMVVDALDLCYTKSHVDIFVIISGDSDFSPLVSKLRENDKMVIGVGVKNSTSDLLMSNCDEFIFYDDLVRQQQQQKKKQQQNRRAAPKVETKQGEKPAEKSQEDKTQEAFDVVQETFDALVAERDDDEKIWGSMIKQALKRRRPGFAESYYGFRSFNALLEAMAKAGLLKLTRDERSGGFLVTAGKD